MTNPIITEAVRALVDRRDLSRLEAAAALEAIMSGAATNAQIAAFLADGYFAWRESSMSSGTVSAFLR